MAGLTESEVERVKAALPPQARLALDAMAKLQNRSPEDVLRDEIRNYIAGRLPAIDIDYAMKTIQTTAYRAGYLIGRLRRFARDQED